MIKEITGRHVLFFFIAFFGIIFVVNGYMIYKSQSSWTGLETYDAYRKGLKYNQQLSISEAQISRGWTMGLDHEKRTKGGFKLIVTPKDKAGEKLVGLDLSVKLKRPTHEGIDQKTILSETGIGIYTSNIDKIPLGKWYLFITASRQGKILYRSKNELTYRSGNELTIQ